MEVSRGGYQRVTQNNININIYIYMYINVYIYIYITDIVICLYMEHII